jgi:hypothetical protein
MGFTSHTLWVGIITRFCHIAAFFFGNRSQITNSDIAP